MSLELCQDEADKCLANIARNITNMLETIADSLQQHGPELRQKFKVNFLKRIHNRSTDVFRRCEWTLPEPNMSATANESTVMARKRSNIKMTSENIAFSTPFLLRNGPTNAPQMPSNIPQMASIKNSMDMMATSANGPKNGSSVLNGTSTNSVATMANGFDHETADFNGRPVNGVAVMGDKIPLSTPFSHRNGPTNAPQMPSNIPQEASIMLDENSMDLFTTSANGQRNGSSVLNGTSTNSVATMTNGFGHETAGFNGKPENGVAVMADEIPLGSRSLKNGPRNAPQQIDLFATSANGQKNGSSVNGTSVNGTSKNDFTNVTNGRETSGFNCKPVAVEPAAKRPKTQFHRNEKKEWMCYYCKEANVRCVQNFVFKTIADLKEHWQSEHSGNSFRFYPIDLLNCTKCGYFSSFQGLHKHHKKTHQDHIFAAINNQGCTLCHYNGSDLDKHLCSEMEDCLRLKMFSPIRLTDESVNELMKVNLAQKIRCKYCQSRFEDRKKMREHHDEEHGNQTMNYDMVEENGEENCARIEWLICGCCNEPIRPNSHVNHIKMIAQGRGNSNHTYKMWKQRFEMDFLKTKVVFSNGLVIFKQNLTKNNFGGYPMFKRLVNELFNEAKSKYIDHNSH